MSQTSFDGFRSGPFLIVLALLVVVTGLLIFSLIHGKATASVSYADITCGDITYRVDAEKLNSSAVSASCDRVKASSEALAAYRATMTRFTCQDSTGRTVLGINIPKDLFDDYNKECQEFLAAEGAYQNDLKSQGSNHTAAMQARSAAFTKFNDAHNQLEKKHLEEDNGFFHQKQADHASMNMLIKQLGGSIEIAN